MARLDKNVKQVYKEEIVQSVEHFSSLGLRCLLIATKVLSSEEYEKFDANYNALANSLEREALMGKLIDEIEQDLFLLGATAVEDKLQDKVPETIADLLRASKNFAIIQFEDIKIWMLTGDKLETAENIAISCRLISGDMTVLRLAGVSDELKLRDKILEVRDTYELCLKENRKRVIAYYCEFKSLIVEGDVLSILEKNS
jgi:phospholipid-transporting ATPase